MYWHNLRVWNYQPQRIKLRQGWGLNPNPDVVEGYGGGWYFADTQYPTWRNMWNYVIQGRDQLAEFVDFFDTHKGKLFPFWCPSWGSAYTLYSGFNFTPGSSTLTTEKYSSLIYDSDFRSRFPSRKRLRLRDVTSGTYYCAIVTSFDNVSYPDYDVLTVDTAYDSAYGLTRENTQIDFMYCVRFASNVLAVRNLARDVFSVKLPVVEIAWETPGLTTY